MDNELDLWGNVTATNGSAGSALILLQEQAKLLETKTKGKVKAEFCRVRYQHKKKNNSLQLAETMLRTVSALSAVMPREEIIEIDERKNLEDANHFYEQGEYKFEIYSDKYKFRLFTLEYQSVFPLKLEIEYDIIEDKLVSKSVNSIDELKSLLGAVFASNKVRFIIQKMIELGDN